MGRSLARSGSGRGAWRLRVALFGLLTGGLAGQASSEAITGVCPDGSVYIVQERAQIPCRASKEVDPSDVPPLRPEYLSSPYTWQVWNQVNNPNNPYNLIDAARRVRGLRSGALPQGAAPTPPQGPRTALPPPHGARAAFPPPPAVSAAPPQASLPVAPSADGKVGALDLGLSDQQLEDLYLIVHLSQDHVPATLERESAEGQDLFEVRLAHSAAFENRLHAAWSSRGGIGNRRVLLFTAVAKRSEEFWANLTFVQEYLSYQPDAHDPSQLGILRGHLGALHSGDVILGYVVLPEAMKLAKNLDIYWNDRRTRARFGG